MSSTSRSQSSSPDILGPPGDADYLISSPIKPFSGRQSWMSPAFNKRQQQTPIKRRRVSLSPAKSAHSIRFDDVLLPGSPMMKLDSPRRSLSPEKSQQDGNVSPWRIRVTLEATQDEDNENEVRGSPSPKRRRPSTVTTKVPLKDERSPLKDKTPVRKRGRPRKSDVQAQNGSPWPSGASPGNTPGPQEGSAVKRKRGRPRKGTPKPAAPEILVAEDEPSPLPQPSPMDVTADGEAAVEEIRPLSPIDMTVDDGFESDSLGADDLPVANLRPPTPGPQEGNDDTGHNFGRANYDTPIIGSTEHHYQDNDENINSTPSKMPSPSRERLASSARSTRLSRLASSPRTYPSPTPTSSLAEEENHTQDAPVEQLETIDEGLENDVHNPQSDNQDLDPNDEHEEFDSIMESEGFTMISLDTLPSVKQRGLDSSTRISTDNSSKILRDRDNGRIGDRLKRKLPGTIDDLRSDHNSSAKPSPASMKFSSVLQRSAGQTDDLFDLKNQSPANRFFYPELPQVSSPAKPLDFPSELPKKRALPSLARIVRVGIALQGPFRPRGNEIPGSSNASRKRRLENVFSTFSPDTQRELRAAIGLGQELAMRRILREDGPVDEDEPENEPEPAEDPGLENQMDMAQEEEEAAWDEDDEPELVQSPENGRNRHQQHSPVTTQSPAFDDKWQQVHEDPNQAYDQSPGTTSQRAAAGQDREAAWQREREDISRYAEDPTNADRFIYIESDEDMSQDQRVDVDDNVSDGLEAIMEESIEDSRNSAPEHVSISSTASRNADKEEEILDEDENNFDDIWQQPEPSPVEHRQSTHDIQPAADEAEEEDGFDDIWQMEARDHSQLSQGSDERMPAPDQEAMSPWRQMASRSDRDPQSSSPAYVAIEHRDRNLGPTHIRQLRDQEIDLSELLAEEDTPNRARYFNGTSTPRSILRGARSAAPNSSINGSAIKSSPQKRVRLQPISQSSSPEREVEESYSSPVNNRSSQAHSSPAMEYDEQQPQSYQHHSESPEAQDENTVATPEPPRQSIGEPSSWFKRITSLTPRWLKAPQRSRYDSSSNHGSDDEKEDEASDQEEPERVEMHEVTREDPVPDVISISSRSSPHDPESPASRQEPINDQEIREASYASGAPEEENEAVDLTNGEAEVLTGPRPLAVFGFFSDAHYKALRRIYRIAKRHPDRFPYFDAPGRAEIIGDWIWTSDGHHGLPITEVQFAVIDRFVHELAHADVQYGGSGQIDWTEAELHRRLVSIIIGEQIREERKAKSARGASVDTWR